MPQRACSRRRRKFNRAFESVDRTSLKEASVIARSSNFLVPVLKCLRLGLKRYSELGRAASAKVGFRVRKPRSKRLVLDDGAELFNGRANGASAKIAFELN